MQVLVGTHTVLANGGIMAPVGTHVVALAAKHHSCPFVVLTGLHKLSPLFPHDPSVTFNDFRVSLHTGLMQPLYLLSCYSTLACTLLIPFSMRQHLCAGQTVFTSTSSTCLDMPYNVHAWNIQCKYLPES